MGQVKSLLRLNHNKSKREIKILSAGPVLPDAPPQLPRLKISLSTAAEFEEMYGKTKPNSCPRIYLFGDSLTDRAFFESDNGFGWKLKEYYDERVEVVNRGMPPFIFSCWNDLLLVLSGNL